VLRDTAFVHTLSQRREALGGLMEAAREDLRFLAGALRIGADRIR
jgi:hypothetical protein